MALGKTPSVRLLDPIDRVSEVLFGLIMVLTSTGTLSVMTAGRADIRAMIVGALGCNVAWGVIDAGMYLMGCLEERGRGVQTLSAIRQAADRHEARRAIADALPEPLALAAAEHELDAMHERLRGLPAVSQTPRLTKDDWLGAIGVCLWVIASTFPVVIPFLLTSDVRLALRISNAIAIVLLFVCGYAFARCTGLRPWRTGLVMVIVGCCLVGIAIALGG
jgi:hypothetical protein